MNAGKIPQAAIDAAAKSLTEITPNLYQDPHNPDRYFGGLAERALEAALPHIRAQIAKEIRAAKPTLSSHKTGKTLYAYLEYAAQIAEGETK